MSQWGEDSITLLIGGSMDGDLLVAALTQDAKLEMRPQRAGTEEDLRAARLKRDELQGELLLAEGTGTGSDNQPALAELSLQLAQAQAEILALFDEPQLRTTDIDEAYASVSRSSGSSWEVSVEFTPDAAERFAALTKTLAGTGRSLGIFVNGELISALIIDSIFAQEGITGGEAVISGSFSSEESQLLALQLSSKALPAPIELVEQQVVSNPDCPSEG